ncbi:MAG: hypothetical protein ACRYGR_06840 [Janthinobacterium lividum]
MVLSNVDLSSTDEDDIDFTYCHDQIPESFTGFIPSDVYLSSSEEDNIDIVILPKNLVYNQIPKSSSEAPKPFISKFSQKKHLKNYDHKTKGVNYRRGEGLPYTEYTINRLVRDLKD